LRKDVENVYGKVITLRRGNEDLNTKTHISELYNTKENALEIVIDGKHCDAFVLYCIVCDFTNIIFSDF